MPNHSSNNAYWQRSIEELLKEQGSSAEGLSSAEAAERLKTWGANTIRAGRHLSAFRMLLGQFTQPIMLILIAATLVSGFTGEWVDAGIILAIVVGSALLSFFQEYNASNAADRLRSQVQTRAVVLRDG